MLSEERPAGQSYYLLGIMTAAKYAAPKMIKDKLSSVHGSFQDCVEDHEERYQDEVSATQASVFIHVDLVSGHTYIYIVYFCLILVFNRRHCPKRCRGQ